MTGLIIEEDGTQLHYLNDERHRVDGPAEVWADGTEWWWLNGVEMTETEHTQAIAER